jgi:uncharacterized coiled-coil protein SlyX
VNEDIADLQRRYAFQEELLRRLDEALREQDRRLEDLERRLRLVIDQVRSMEQSRPEGDEPPPPHY